MRVAPAGSAPLPEAAEPARRPASGEGYGGWLRDDGRGGLVMARGMHSGSLLDGVPTGYLRHLLTLRLPPAARLAFLVAAGEVEAPPPLPRSAGDEWVPFALGDEVSGMVHAEVAALFLAEYRRLSALVESAEPTRVLEAMAVLSSQTPSASLL